MLRDNDTCLCAYIFVFTHIYICTHVFDQMPPPLQSQSPSSNLSLLLLLTMWRHPLLLLLLRKVPLTVLCHVKIIQAVTELEVCVRCIYISVWLTWWMNSKLKTTNCAVWRSQCNASAGCSMSFNLLLRSFDHCLCHTAIVNSAAKTTSSKSAAATSDKTSTSAAVTANLPVEMLTVTPSVTKSNDGKCFIWCQFLWGPEMLSRWWLLYHYYCASDQCIC